MPNDLFARVTVSAKGASGFPIPGGRSDVLVRIPFEVAASLTGSRNPTHNHIKIFQRFAGAAADARGRPGATNIVQAVDAGDVVPANVDLSDMGSPNWSDKSGVQAWLLTSAKSLR